MANNMDLQAHFNRAIKNGDSAESYFQQEFVAESNKRAIERFKEYAIKEIDMAILKRVNQIILQRSDYHIGSVDQPKESHKGTSKLGQGSPRNG
jgi:hypothetical protein